MTKLRIVSDGAERRVKLTAREIVFAAALSAAAVVSIFVASAKLPDSETASNEPVKFDAINTSN